MTTRRVKRIIRQRAKYAREHAWNGSLKKGDTVMVISGGNKKKRPIKGQVGKILRFAGEHGDRVVIEGVNMVTRHQRAQGPNKPAGKIQKEAAVHVSNVMYYVEKIKRPVRLKNRELADGTKVRGYINPENKQFVQLDTVTRAKEKV